MPVQSAHRSVLKTLRSLAMGAMLRRLIGVVLVGIGLLSACTTPMENFAESSARRALPALKLLPSSLGMDLNLAQRLTIEPASHARSLPPDAPRTLEAQLEADADQVRVAAFALGQRVLGLIWDGKELQATRHASLPAMIDATHVLRDVQLVYWPEQAVRGALPAGWTITDRAQSRILAQNGEPRVEIKYSGVPRWNGRIELDNRPEGYRLIIESQVQADTSGLP